MDDVQEQKGSSDEFLLRLVEINLNFFIFSSLDADVCQCFEDVPDIAGA